MKAVILAGGLGTRLSEETSIKPKPMVEIGGKPILWHIMKTYAQHGVREFVICLGYKGYVIKEFFANYLLHHANVTIETRSGELQLHDHQAEDWKVTLVDTGPDTHTGGRLKRVRRFLGVEDFCMTYGDGVGDVDITALIDFHKSHGKLATVTAVKQPGRFGVLEMQDHNVTGFTEKPHGEAGWINGGYFVLNPKALDYITDEFEPWEQTPMKKLADEGQMSAFTHDGFWQPMDTLRDKRYLEDLWQNDKAPWKVWT